MGFCKVTFLIGKKSDVKFENIDFFFKLCIGICRIFFKFEISCFGLVLVFGRRSVA